MKHPLSALVVHDDQNLVEELRTVLQVHGLATRCAHTCWEVRAAFARRHPPDVVFTGGTLPDGDWREVLRRARAAKPHAEVVIALDQEGPLLDAGEIQIYLDAVAQGAFDFIVPPFPPDELARVVRSVFLAVIRRRNRSAAGPAVIPIRPPWDRLYHGARRSQ